MHTLVEFWLAVILRAPRALSQALYETMEGSERLLDDLKVLNLNRVYAAGCIYNAMRVAQGEVAEPAGLLPQAISPVKLFSKLAAAYHCHAIFQVVVPRRPAR